jgi:hypothetical protein
VTRGSGKSEKSIGDGLTTYDPTGASKARKAEGKPIFKEYFVLNEQLGRDNQPTPAEKLAGHPCKTRASF